MVYFKSLYSPAPEVKDMAHEGLRMVLTHQSRLPKELLQAGLPAILMKLADPTRLSIQAWRVARLLELLTNYFKVEIGHKLLDHSELSPILRCCTSSRLPLLENEGIKKLVLSCEHLPSFAFSGQHVLRESGECHPAN